MNWSEETRQVKSVVFSPGLSQSPEIFAHEYLHAYMHYYNPGFVVHAEQSADPVPPFAQDLAGLAILEGLADAVGLSYGLLTQYSGDTGPPWHMGVGYIDNPRDVSEPRKWDWLANDSATYHARGMALGNFFYRLAELSNTSV